jgi:hypothetical protein
MKRISIRPEDLEVTSFETAPSRLDEWSVAGPRTVPMTCGCGTYNGCTTPQVAC